MNYPADLKYTKSDEWIRIEGNVATMGISDYAQDALSDIVFLEYAVEAGEDVAKGDTLGTIESVKAASDIYFPLGGKIVEVNEALLDTPENVNADAYGEAWMVKIELSDTGELDVLMDAAAYEADVKSRE